MRIQIRGAAHTHSNKVAEVACREVIIALRNVLADHNASPLSWVRHLAVAESRLNSHPLPSGLTPREMFYQTDRVFSPVDRFPLENSNPTKFTTNQDVWHFPAADDPKATSQKLAMPGRAAVVLKIDGSTRILIRTLHDGKQTVATARQLKPRTALTPPPFTSPITLAPRTPTPTSPIPLIPPAPQPPPSPTPAHPHPTPKIPKQKNAVDSSSISFPPFSSLPPSLLYLAPDSCSPDHYSSLFYSHSFLFDLPSYDSSRPILALGRLVDLRDGTATLHLHGHAKKTDAHTAENIFSISRESTCLFR